MHKFKQITKNTKKTKKWK